jgi:Lrp/AsnC family transcriptional regulator for asnA, asnC and gidA
VPINLDELDHKLIAALLEEAKLTNAELAKRLYSTEATIRRRRRLLTESGVIREAIVADPFLLGYNVMALIGFQIDRGKTEPILQALRDLPELRFVGVTLGHYDLLAEAWFRSSEALLDFVTADLGRIPGIQRTETLQVLRLVKYAYDWGQPNRDVPVPA